MCLVSIYQEKIIAIRGAMCDSLLSQKPNFVRYSWLFYLKSVLSDLLVLCARHRVRFHSMDSSVRHAVLVSVVNVTA